MKLYHRRGFTVGELLVWITIVSVLSVVGLNQYVLIKDSINQRNAEMTLLGDLRYAQAKSVEQGCRGIVTVAADGGSYTFGCDYVAYSTATPPVHDTLFLTRVLPDNVRITTSTQIFFNSRGQSISVSEAMQTVSVQLQINRSGTYFTYSTGTIYPTGFFAFS